jgi:serine protease SohB
MEHLADYAVFFAKFATAGIIIVLVLIAVAVIAARARRAETEHLEVKNLNKKLESMSFLLKAAILPGKEYKKALKASRKSDKQRAKTAQVEHGRRRIFVCRFRGDVRASAVAALGEEITAILTIARPQDEVVVVIESAGGTVHGYGLGASQLQRVRNRGIPLTAAVDKIAASGGYMMACVANKIIAAPFAVVGSIGVIAQLPNFNRMLKKHDIDFEQITAGKYKRTLTLFGENTEEDRHKLREELKDAHELFKEFVREHRPQVDLDQIATGEHWFGARALAMHLVDELSTSDDYLAEQAANADVFEVRYAYKRHWYEKFLAAARAAVGAG